MHFKKIVLFILVVYIAAACNDEALTNAGIEAPAMTAEEVTQVLSEITYIGELPNGQMLNFRASDYINQTDGNYFTDVGGTHFPSAPQGYNSLVNQLSNSGGEIDIRFNGSNEPYLVTFQYVLITTFKELSEMYPDYVYTNSTNEDWIVAIAFGSNELTAENVFDGSFFNVTDYLSLVADPDSDFVYASEYYDVNLGYFFSLTGDYTYRNSLVSSGEIGFYDYFSERFELVGDYNLILKD